MDEHKRRPFADGEPPIAKLHESDEARIEIETHLCEPVLLALSDVRRNLPKDLEPSQLSQAVGQRGASNVRVLKKASRIMRNAQASETISRVRATEQFRSPRTGLASFARCGVTAMEGARPGAILAVGERAITVASVPRDRAMRPSAM